MRPADLPAVLTVQRAAYGDAYQESAGVLGAKLELAPAACWLAEREGEVLGYVFAHPWRRTPPPLHAALDAAEDAELAFLHDLAVAPAGRGAGLAAALFGEVAAWAGRCGFAELALVALPDACGFWRRHGFSAVADVAQGVPADYGPGATLMRLVLDADACSR